MKISFSDILTLAKQGYTPADIKELVNLNIADQEQTPIIEDNNKSHEEAAESEQATHDDSISDVESVARENDIDYKKLYEESQNKLQNLQKANTNQNIKDADTKSDDVILSDIVRSFM